MKNKMVLAVSVFLMISAILIAGCTSATEDKNADEPMPAEEVTLTVQDKDTTLTIKSGEVFHIVLEGNITTGYTWEVGELEEALLQQQGEMEYRQPESSTDSTAEEPLAGAPGEFSFSFKALKAGDTELRLIYHRTFEPDVALLVDFSITVHIVG